MESIARITGGVDTHLDVHVVAALDDGGGLLGTVSFPADPTGYGALLAWLRSFGELVLVGVEGTGSYGAGLARLLHRSGVAVVEVDRPNRADRRKRGKSDTLDAIAAARAAHAGTATGRPKTRDGNIESIRVLRTARQSAHKARTQAINQIRSLVCTAPDELREKLRHLTQVDLVRTCAGLRPSATFDVTTATRASLRLLARRVHELEAEIDELNRILKPLVTQTAPALLSHYGVGTDTAGALLVAVGDNPDRLRRGAAFARLCGVAPIPATSGKTQNRHRLHRGGDRHANSALWRIVMTRMSGDPRTKAYIARRTDKQLTTIEAMRCLKRYVARELFADLPQQLLS